ncbi:MAG: sigma-54-dependent Fis family transcriptional regulator [Flavobacteriales bacterium]|nr:sigma-54-dependent Fis family transcriptional regulator [Flavobacteriales bacterium]|tara:strand:- start:14675 stop:15946 length:1272 start_codon:yes stop_codon:yes gene_type:complete
MSNTLNGIKQRFGIIGNSNLLNDAIDIAMQVAPTDLSVLVSGESGSGKENFAKIIHSQSARKHNDFIAVNCGAIPDGTIDSELFGHEKGAFTGAVDHRKGYFEVADGGTIFLDEVGELPMSTQARLLRVLEAGEFIKVGSSKVQKTNIRVVAATNLDIPKAIKKGKFREDLYYRLNTIPIKIPSLRERKEDIYLLFRKFSVDLAEKYRMPPLRLDEEAREILENYRWPGNIRQLKNIAEQISVIEENRLVTRNQLLKYLPEASTSNLPVIIGNDSINDSDPAQSSDWKRERELLYKALFDMKRELRGLKGVVTDLVRNHGNIKDTESAFQQLNLEGDKLPPQELTSYPVPVSKTFDAQPTQENEEDYHDSHEVVEESLSLAEREKEFIIKALDKHRGKRKNAAKELGISERTLYRKIKEYGIQ